MAKSEELQKQTQRVLTELGTPGKPLSARALGERLDIGYNQIADMAKGKAPGEKTLIKFARALHENPADWLRYAGKHDFAKTMDEAAGPGISEEDRIARLIAEDLASLLPEQRRLLVHQIRALIAAARECQG